MSPKTILIPITSNFFIRNFLRTDAARIIARNSRIRLVFLASEDKVEYYRKEFPLKNAVFDVLTAQGGSPRERLFKFWETASIHSRTAAMLQYWEAHRRGSKVFSLKRFIVFGLKRICWLLGKFRWWRQLIRKTYFSFSEQSAQRLITRYRPDLVFCPTMLGRDYLLLKEAKRYGIKTAGMLLSWDNLFSKTLLRVHPDQLLVHTDWIRRDALFFGDYPSERITTTGIPQYDRYFQRDGIESREEFIRKLGGDPSKKLILYAFSGKAGLQIDFDMVDILHKLLESGEIGEPVQILLRPYPRYDFSAQKLKEIRSEYGFLVESPISHVGENKDSWEFDERSLSYLTKSLAHADLVITIYSTFFIEAAIFDKPLIGIAFDGYQKLDYWNSAIRFFEWDHLSALRPLGGIWRVRSRQELAEAINTYLKNPSLHQEGRKKIVEQQCQFTDGLAGKRVAKALLGSLSEV